MRRLYFPLRTSVELFADPTSVAAAARAKEAVVLYDEVVFEAGLFEVQMLEGGSFSNWRPPESLSREDLANSRQLHEVGSEFTLAMGKQPAQGVPAPPEAMHAFLSGPITKSYAAEWHSEAIDELRELNPEWARYTVTEDGGEAIRSLREPIAAAERAALEISRELKMDPWIGAFAAKALARDATVAADMGAAFSVTSLFEPLVVGLEAEPDPAGGTALGFLIPDVGGLPWEAIAEYREHPGSEDARGKLREFEQRALAAEADDPLEFQAAVFQSITADLFGAIHDLQGNLAKDLAEEAAKTGIAFIPVVGPILGPGASLAQTVGTHMKEQRTWYAALMKLRQLAG
jgi:hypothetical protein